MKNFVLILFVFFSVNACRAQGMLEKLKSTQRFVLKVDNNNIQSIGYKHYEEDMDIGVNSIFKSDVNIYISDPFHKNIKALNINSGEVKVSNELFPWITDIVVCHGKICVVSEYEGGKILNIDLSLDKEIGLPKGHKYFIEHNNEIYIINASVFERKEELMSYQAYNLSAFMKSGILEKVSLTFERLPLRVGFSNKEKQLDGRIYLEVGSRYYEIPHKLREIEEYDAHNIFVNNGEIVYYFIDKNELIIEIFNY